MKKIITINNEKFLYTGKLSKYIELKRYYKLLIKLYCNNLSTIIYDDNLKLAIMKIISNKNIFSKNLKIL